MQVGTDLAGADPVGAGAAHAGPGLPAPEVQLTFKLINSKVGNNKRRNDQQGSPLICIAFAKWFNILITNDFTILNLLVLKAKHRTDLNWYNISITFILKF